MVSSKTLWESLSAPPPLTPGMVIVMRFSLSDQEDSELQDVDLAVLEASERVRMARLMRPRDQRRFRRGRATLRTILGHYTGQSPGAVRFVYGTHGKPELAPGQREGLRFNLSNSGDLAVCAVVLNRTVGLDLEFCRERVAAPGIARRYFHPDETAYLESLTPETTERAFYQLWTAKEALLKGVGGGLTIPLSRCKFDLTRSPFGLDLVDLPAIAGGNWVVTPFSIEDGYAAALATDEGDVSKRFIDGDCLPVAP